MGVEGTLGIPANEALKSDKLRSESPIVLPSVSVMTNLVAELPDVDPADSRGTGHRWGLENDSGLTLGV